MMLSDVCQLNSNLSVKNTIVQKYEGPGVQVKSCLTFVCLTSVEYIGPKSRTERPRKTKIDTEVGHITCDLDTTFKVKNSKVRVTRLLYSPLR